ncbi:MAG: ferric reductase-like transmembrane domain-containing protein, partial [Bryobacteraceae bacterium]|nr:ferric reductase-like transmembrane domain-containing protein [Bryobacteraceae bacterium]
MSVEYKAVLWNRQKRVYDYVLAAGILLYLAVFVGIGALIHPGATIETLLIRGLGTAALMLLHVALCIGPLTRLDPRFLPLLYNRRHLGVTTFILGLAHSVFSTIQFHALGDINPLASILISNTRFNTVSQFPFQQLGLLALAILFLLAATSHDFWLHVLTPIWWKRLHMSVYLAYFLLLGHVLLGALQSETNPILTATLLAGAAVVIILHILAAQKENRLDTAYREVCDVVDIPDFRATVVNVGGERVAVFRYGSRISAVSSV